MRVLKARGLVALCLLALGSGCSRSAPAPVQVPPPAAEREILDEAGRALFAAEALEGAFVLHDARRRTTTVVGAELSSTPFVPASTFKIPNTLVGLETGVIPDERFALPWDGTRRSFEAWNRDHDLASAMKYSVVWFYQEVARRIGAERMKGGLTGLGYGSGDLSGGIDRFWLDDGSLRITPREQVAFLRRLHEGALPVSRAHAELVQRLIVLEERPGVVLRGKTGGATQDGRAVGWLVGYVDRGAEHFTYALLVLSKPGGDVEAALSLAMPRRKPLARRFLVRAGALPAEMGDEPGP